ncbi:MAG: amidohydrolase family protein, partial [Bacteroidia bacterium]|nr:amidohydrolase family protein [Bacteroidia bacterium]
TVRYPQTRMGVEQVFYDAFSRAKEYQQTWNNWDELNASKKKNTAPPARDLELDALVEILEAKRFITCHSYVQSEINMLMHVADSMGFKVNTFTHILEGYKVADKMKKHGAAGSTFSDWWAYKMEVAEAIPYNGALMHEVGVLTGFNSDDAEMGRRLNQEAAKAVLYGGLSEEEALKFVTINPAKMLHIDKFTGSLKVGKDADFVIWDSNPLSIYAKAKATFVEGVRYYDQERDKELQIQANQERTRLRMKMIQEKSEGKKLRKTGGVKQQHSYECEDLIHLEENFLLLEHNR